MNLFSSPPDSPDRLAIIAGNGDLPRMLIEQCQQKGLFCSIIAFEGQTPTDIQERLTPETPILWVKLGCIEPILTFLKSNKITTITMAGGIARPRIRDLSLDWVGSKWIASLGTLAFKGDDHLLRGLMGLIEKEGYNIRAPHDYLDSLFLTKGVHTIIQPDSADLADIKQGIAIITALSPHDVGQSVIVREGITIGIEAIEGTQKLLERVNDYELVWPLTKGSILVKMPKQGQSTRVDMPTIGIQTIEQAKNAYLKGIAIQANGVQILNRDQIIEEANKAGLFIYAF